jgi:hypothetical protein
MTGKKTGGRVAGTPNRLTKELRTVLRDMISAELDALPTTLEGLPPKERLDVVIKLLPFCLPKVQAVKSDYDSPPFLLDWG